MHNMSGLKCCIKLQGDGNSEVPFVLSTVHELLALHFNHCDLVSLPNLTHIGIEIMFH